MEKHLEEAKYNAAFDRFVAVLTQMILKYGPQILEEQKKEALRTEGHKRTQPTLRKTA